MRGRGNSEESASIPSIYRHHYYGFPTANDEMKFYYKD